MRSKPIIKKFFAIAATLTLLVGAAVAAAPFFVDGLLLRETLAARLSQFTGGDVTIKGRVGIASFLSLTVDAETVEIKNVRDFGPIEHFTVARITASIDWMDLIFGSRRFETLTIEQPQIALGANVDGSSNDGEATLRQLVSAIETAPFETIVIKDASFYSLGATVPLQITNAHFSQSAETRKLAAKGAVIWKNEALSFRARRGAERTVGPDGASAPFDLAISGVALNVKFDGAMGLSPKLSLNGALRFATADVSVLPRWLNFDWSLPEAVNALTADGVLRWSHGELGLDQAVMSLNGNEASGSIAIKMRDACPFIEGALAFQTFSFNRFNMPALSSGAASALALHSCLGADIRVSAERVIADNFRTGAAAAAVNIRNGKITANVAELEMFDGVLRGNVEVDLAGAAPIWVVQATGKDIDVSRITDAAHQGVWLEGLADANLELRAVGSNFEDAAKSLSGHAKIQFPSGGSLGVPLTEHIMRVARGSPHLAEIVPAKFSRMRLDAGAVDGLVATRSLEINSDDHAFTGSGSVDIPARSVDWRLDVRSGLASAAKALKSSIEVVVENTGASRMVTIQGPWSAPDIQLDRKPLTLPGVEMAPY